MTQHPAAPRKASLGPEESFTVVLAMLACAFPGAALSALCWRLALHLRQIPNRIIVTVLAVSGLGLALTYSDMLPFAIFRLFAPVEVLAIYHIAPLNDTGSVVMATLAQAFLGPPSYYLISFAYTHLHGGSLRHQHERWVKERRRIEQLMVNGLPERAHDKPLHQDAIGVRLRDRKPVILHPKDLALGGAVVGQPGKGKTVLAQTLIRLILGWVRRSPSSAVVIDPKNDARFREFLRTLAEKAGIPFFEISDRPTSWNLNPFRDDTSEGVAAKLPASMDFGPHAGIYRDMSVHILYLVDQALRATGREVTLQSLAASLVPNNLLALAATSDEPELKELALAAVGKKTTLSEGISGLRTRLSRMYRSNMGKMLSPQPGRPILDLRETLAKPCVIYIGTSVHAADADDARLFLNVFLALLGALAKERNDAIAAGDDPIQITLFLDEFAQLARAGGNVEATEARLSNIYELCRSSKIALFSFMQVLPQSRELLADIFAAGLQFTFSTPEAEQIAKQLGTSPSTTITHKLGVDGEASGEGTLTQAESWIISPNALKRAAVGNAMFRKGNDEPEPIALRWDG